MKFIVRTVVLLFIINGALLYMHYSQAGSAASKDAEVPSFSQEIEVIHRSDALYIRHHFTQLSEGRLEIVWPEASTERACYDADATSCTRLNGDLTAFLEGDNARQSITYQIPKETPMEQSALFKKPFAELHHGIIQSTVFHITDEMGVGGVWVSGLKRVGQKEMDLIDYSLFSGTGKISDLYWQKDVQPLVFEGDRLSVYGGLVDEEALGEIDTSLKQINAAHSTIVIDQSKSFINSNRFIIADTPNAEMLAGNFLVNSMYERFTIPEEQPLLAESIASILGGKGVGSEKSRVLFDELTEALTAEEMITLTRQLNDMTGDVLDASVLDELAGKAMGFGTSFFKKNIQENVAFYPFLLEDLRDIVVAGTKDSESKILLKDGKTLYPAKKILDMTGYNVSSNENSLYIENGARTFRFPLRELFYVYNDRKFSVMSAPFEVHQDEFYFEEGWLMRLFLFEIEKNKDTIEITPKTMFQKGGSAE